MTGYWHTATGTYRQTMRGELDPIPEGWVQTSTVRPSGQHVWQNNSWVLVAPTLAEIRAQHTCTAVQGRLALWTLGRRAAFMQWFNAQTVENQILAEGLLQWDRSGKFVQAWKNGLDVTEAQLDAFYGVATEIDPDRE